MTISGPQWTTLTLLSYSLAATAMSTAGWSNASASIAVDPTGSFTLFSLYGPSVAIQNNRLYIEGGSLRLSPPGEISAFKTVDRANTRLLWLDLTTAFDWANHRVFSDSKPRSTPNQQQGVAFTGNASDGRFFIFGGSLGYTNSSAPDYVPPPVQNLRQFWYFDLRQSEQQHWTTATIDSASGVQNVVHGAAATDARRGVGYYLDGEINSDVVRSSPSYAVTGLVSFRFSDLSWKNTTTSRYSSTVGGLMEYVPVGKQGILVVFGGKTADAGKDSSKATMNDMSLIRIYDIDSDSWYDQTATGGGDRGFPYSRTGSCSVMVPSPDNSTFNIYVQGGENQTGLLGDVWVLSLPSFTWIDVVDSDSDIGQRGHTCKAVGKHMFSICGGVGAYSAPLFYIFDMVQLAWTNSYNPKAGPYGIPQAISSVIGGDSKGGRTLAPPSGWTSAELGEIFAARPGEDGISSSPPPPTAPASKQLTTGEMAGIIVGSIVGFAALVILAVLVLKRWWPKEWLPSKPPPII
ncbi:hypothetical protein B0T25DRAFT_263933 [Lasiosphaeria hispida]|uniref:Kelch repeat protein n=1 Tax=Lasiosphaeria hispida TaxID=260671 RepID=A0AAJ0HGD7_9PEZI|nr:hypothetical protein B0T25DRAFT_263933 [Lasiosphaeria hispida]